MRRWRFTAVEWQTSREPEAMLLALRERSERVAAVRQTPERKLRLFGVGCCKRVWPALTATSRTIVDRVERACDDSGPLRGKRHIADFSSRMVKLDKDRRQSGKLAAEALRIDDPISAAMNACQYAVCTDPSDEFMRSERPALASLLRCIVGNPYRPSTFDPSWRTPTVSAIAEGVYADRAFDRRPVLADALEDAGCDQAELLAHLRGPGPHARGCWPVDLVLGKA